MISRVLSDSFITFKNNFKKIFLMSLPVIILSFLDNGVTKSVGNSVSKSLNQLNVNDISFDSVINVFSNYIGSGIGSYLIGILLTYLEISLIMGYLKSDQENNFEFKNAFALFLQKNTWWKIILIALVFAISLGIIVGIFAILIAIAALVIKSAILTFFISLALFVLMVFIFITFYFKYLNYYDDIDKGNETGILKSFKNVWELINGYRGTYFGLMVIILLFKAGFSSVILIIFGAFSIIFNIIPGFGELFSSISTYIVLLISLFLNIYTDIVTVKFFKEIKK